jgi:cytochrome c-type biogenesis protein
LLCFRITIAFGWTPCIGPQLGAILALAANEGSVLKGTSLLALYALGLGVPFLLSALFISQSVTIIRKLQKHMLLVERLMGLLLLVVGILLFTGGFSKISFFLLDVFPLLAYIG